VETMVAILILTIGLLGVGYGLHVSYKIDNDSIGLLHRSEYKKDSDGKDIIDPTTNDKVEVKTGLRDVFNDGQLSVYGTLK